MSEEHKQDRKQSSRRERYTTGRFYDKLVEGMRTSPISNSPMLDFNTFCCQTDPDLREILGNRYAGFLSLTDVATYYNLDYKTARKGIINGELVAMIIGGVYRIPGVAVLLHLNVGCWHTMEPDRDTRIKAVHEGDLSVLDSYHSPSSIPNMWKAFVLTGMRTFPAGCSWQELVQSSSQKPPGW